MWLITLLLLMMHGSQKLDAKSNTTAEDIQKYSKLYREMVDHGAKIHEQLGRVSLESKSLHILAGRVGSLISAAAETDFSPESDEQIAIKELYQFTLREYNRVKVKLEVLTEEESFNEVYNSRVTEYLVGLEAARRQAAHPNYSSRLAHKMKFIEACSEDYKPHKIINWMASKFIINCPLPFSQKEIFEKFVDVTDAYEKLIFESRKEWDQIEAKKVLLSSFGEFDNKEKILEAVRKAKLNFGRFDVESFRSSLYKISDQMTKDTSTSSCYFQLLNQKDDPYKKRIINLMRRVTQDLIDASIEVTTCFDMLNSNATETVREAIQLSTAAQVEQIVHHFASYLERIVENAWPSEIKVKIQNRLGADKILEPAYNDTADLIRMILGEIPKDNVQYNVIISPKLMEKYGFTHACVGHQRQNYVQIVDRQDVNIYIIRSPQDEEIRAERGAQYLNEHEEIIMSDLDDSRSERAQVIWKSLKPTRREYISEDKFHHVMLFKKEDFPRRAKIPLGISGNANFGTLPIFYVHYHNRGDYFWDTTIKMIFLL